MVERSCYFRWSELIIRVMSPGLSQELTPQTKPGTTAPPTPLEVPIPTYESLTFHLRDRLTKASSCEVILQFLERAPPSGFKWN